MAWNDKYCIYKGKEYRLLLYASGRVELRDLDLSKPSLIDSCGNISSSKFVDRHEINNIYYKHVYGDVDGYRVKVIDDKDAFNFYVETESSSTARALSLCERKGNVFRGYVKKSDVKVTIVKVKLKLKKENKL